MTREQIDDVLALWTPDSSYPASTVRALCTLALEGLALRAENERLKAAEIAGREVLLPAKREQVQRVVEEATKTLRAENERLRAAISWIEPPFVDGNTPEAELRTRIRICVEDKRRALERKPE